MNQTLNIVHLYIKMKGNIKRKHMFGLTIETLLNQRMLLKDQ